MAFYNLRKGGQNLTYFEVYYYSGERTKLTLEYHFNINFLYSYEVSKMFGDKQDQFVKELDGLQTEFYDFMFCAIESGTIKPFLPLGTDYKIREDEKKKVYDWFLPKQKAFADKWGLVINVD